MKYGNISYASPLLYVYNNIYNKKSYLGMSPFSGVKGFTVVLVSIGSSATFLSRRDSINSSKGLEKIVNGGICHLQSILRNVVI